jgi:hypothetical protein
MITTRSESNVPLEDVHYISGHRLSASYSLPKVLWLRDHQKVYPIFEACYHQLLPIYDMIAEAE